MGVRKEDRPLCQRFNYTGIVDSTKGCPCVPSSELYPTSTVQSLFEVWTCDKDFEHCERHKGAFASELVVLTLLPNGRHLRLGEKRAPARPSGPGGPDPSFRLVVRGTSSSFRTGDSASREAWRRSF